MHDPHRQNDLLARALRDLHAMLARLGVGLASSDPLRLALPALPAAEAARPAPDVLAAYAALYLHAELEDAGVLPAVEALSEQRNALALQDRVTAERLERFARAARDYPAAAQRAQIFARLFAMGPEATRNLQAMAATRAFGAEDAIRLDFRQRVLRFATAVVRADLERARLGGTPGLASQAAWRAAADDLRAMIAALPAGSLVQWARRIHARVLQAFEILGDAGLQRQLGARTPWQALQRLLPDEGADRRDAAARRAAAGQALLRSLGGASAGAPDTEAVQAALRWLIASGLPVPGETFAGGPLPMPRTAFAAEPGA